MSIDLRRYLPLRTRIRLRRDHVIDRCCMALLSYHHQGPCFSKRSWPHRIREALAERIWRTFGLWT